MSLTSPQLPTVGVIAVRLGVPSHRVEYVLRTRAITPSGWAGNARVYDEAAVVRIRSELDRIAREEGDVDA